MLSLPKNNEIIKAKSTNPKRLLIMSFPKCGKTKACLALKDSILVDLEDSSTLYEGTKILLSDVVKSQNVSKLRALKMIADAIKADPRKYVILDTVTEIQDIAREYATLLYKNTLQGKGFTGKDVVSELPQGSGYMYLRNAMDEILSWFEGTYTESIILLGHVKLASLNKDSKDIQVKDLDITGKSKQLLCKDADAIGILYREKGGTKNILSFKTDETTIVMGARPPHLANQEIVLSEMVEDNLVTHWDKIFLTE